MNERKENDVKENKVYYPNLGRSHKFHLILQMKLVITCLTCVEGIPEI